MKKKTTEIIADKIAIFCKPINYDKLIENKLLRKVGKSYYVDNIHKLPKEVSSKISSVRTTKNGTKVTFLKISKRLQHFATKHGLI